MARRKRRNENSRIVIVTQLPASKGSTGTKGGGGAHIGALRLSWAVPRLPEPPKSQR